MKPIHISLNDLETVVAVIQEGSFRAAADFLNISQPSVSARIRHAEDILGVTLFHRSTRRVEVTEHGKQLGIRAERTITDLRTLIQDFKDEAHLKKGSVVIGATPSVAATTLPSILQKFIKNWPGVELMLRDDFFGRALERLSTGEVDFAVMPFRNTDSTFEFETLYWEELVVVTSHRHPLVRTGVAELSQIASYPLLSMAPQSAMWKTLNNIFIANDLQFNPSFFTLHQMTLLAMVKEGLGITFLPSMSLKLLNMEGLSVAHVIPSRIFRQVGLTTARMRAIQPAAKSLMALLRSELRQDSPDFSVK